MNNPLASHESKLNWFVLLYLIGYQALHLNVSTSDNAKK